MAGVAYDQCSAGVRAWQAHDERPELLVRARRVNVGLEMARRRSIDLECGSVSVSSTTE
jgi:hypothetical protein